MKKLLPILTILGVLAIALWLTPLPQPPAPEETPQLVVGFVMHLSENSWRDKVYASLEEAAQAQNIQLINIETARTQEAQIQALRALITYRVDAIVFSPLVLRGWDNVLRDAKAAGIPVLALHRNVQTEVEGAIAAYIGANYEEQGRMAAHFIVERTRRDPGSRLIMEIHGTVGASDTVERSRGIRGLFGQAEEYEIYSTMSCNFLQSWAREAMRAHLRTGRTPDIVISYSDSMTLGAIEAIEAAGLAPGKDMLLISFDAQQDAMALLAEGKINCIIENDPNVGEAVMNAARTLAETGSAEDVLLPSRIFLDTDDIAALAPRGY